MVAVNRIRWTEREINEVVGAASKVLAEKQCSLLEALREGQKVLEDWRQRPETSLIKISQQRTEQDKLIVFDIESGAKKYLVEKESRKKVTSELIKQIPEVESLLNRFRLEVRKAYDEVIEQELNRARYELARRLKELQDEMKKVRSEESTEEKPVVTENRAYRKRVLIIGMDPTKQQVVKKHFPNIDLRFIHQEFSRIKSRMRGVDNVLAWVSMTSHVATTLAKHHPGYVPCNNEMEIYDFLTKASE